MNPSQPTPPTQPLPASVEEQARQVADKAISFVEGTVREWLPPGEFAPKRDALIALLLAFARTVHSAELTEAKRQRDCERSIKEAEKKILITEIENHTVCRARLSASESALTGANEELKLSDILSKETARGAGLLAESHYAIIAQLTAALAGAGDKKEGV